MELPFPLGKNHKKYTKSKWKIYGVIFKDDEDFQKIYLRCIHSTNCELCGKQYKTSKERHLDHDHETGEFRNIVCRKCNRLKEDVKIKSDNTTGEKYISKCKEKSYTQGFCFRIQIRRDGKSFFSRSRKTLEEAIIVRDKFIKEHPEIFT